jgi:hypothetical protein
MNVKKEPGHALRNVSSRRGREEWRIMEATLDNREPVLREQLGR